MSVRDKIQTLIDSDPEAMEALDELVHDAAGDMASAANNDGLSAQLEFLEKRQITEEDVLAQLTEEDDGDDDGE